MTRKKPIVVVKSGRTKAGARAAASHTGALAGVDVAIDALLAQCGVLRAESVQELFDIAMALGGPAHPPGNRVAIVTNAGGPGIMIADACESQGLEIVELSAETQARLREMFPAEASVRNPGGHDRVGDVRVVPPGAGDRARRPERGRGHRGLRTAAGRAPGGRGVLHRRGVPEPKPADKPILAVLMGRHGLPEGRAELHEAGRPRLHLPGVGRAGALAAMVRYRRWLERPVQEPTRFEVDHDARREPSWTASAPTGAPA